MLLLPQSYQVPRMFFQSLQTYPLSSISIFSRSQVFHRSLPDIELIYFYVKVPNSPVYSMTIESYLWNTQPDYILSLYIPRWYRFTTSLNQNQIWVHNPLQVCCMLIKNPWYMQIVYIGRNSLYLGRSLQVLQYLQASIQALLKLPHIYLSYLNLLSYFEEVFPS